MLRPASKHAIIVLLLTACIFPAALLGQKQETDSQHAYSLLLECERYRESHFKHGWMKLWITDLAPDARGGERVKSEERQTLWFSDDCLRKDVTSGPALAKVSVCNGVYLWSPDGPFPVTIAPASEHADAKAHFNLFHPRWIGMGYNPPGALARDRSFRCVPIRPDGQPTAISSLRKETVDGVPLWRLEFSTSGQVDVALLSSQMQVNKVTAERTIVIRDSEDPSRPPSNWKRFITNEVRWISPAQGYGLVRSHSEDSYPDDNSHVVRDLRTLYALDTASQIWYPKITSYTMHNNGLFFEGLKVRVEEASFQPPPASVFSIEGLSLPPGRRVDDRTKGKFQKSSFWDGEKLIPIPNPWQPVDHTAMHSFWRRALLIVNALALVALGVFLIFRRTRSRERRIT